MANHVEIDRATKRLGSLIAAALRGEDVVLDRSGEPQVRLVALSEKEALEARAAKRAASAVIAQ